MQEYEFHAKYKGMKLSGSFQPERIGPLELYSRFIMTMTLSNS